MTTATHDTNKRLSMIAKRSYGTFSGSKPITPGYAEISYISTRVTFRSPTPCKTMFRVSLENYTMGNVESLIGTEEFEVLV
jgi:hypothetical protein